MYKKFSIPFTEFNLEDLSIYLIKLIYGAKVHLFSS